MSVRANGSLFLTASPCAFAASSSDLPLASASAIACAFCSPSSLIFLFSTSARTRSFTCASGAVVSSFFDARRMTW